MSPRARVPGGAGPRSSMLMVIALAIALGLPDEASARRPTVPEAVAERLRDEEKVVTAARKAAGEPDDTGSTALAKRLVDAQLRLVEGDREGAAIAFLDLIENHRESEAGVQAVYYLGEALMQLGMTRWAAEQFSNNLKDRRPGARRFWQRSVSRFLDLAAPRREPGFARRPGLSATPEIRARMQSIGLRPELAPLRPEIHAADAERLEHWVESYARDARELELQYSFGRYLFLTGRSERARDELDALAPEDIILPGPGPGGAFRVRAAYVAGAAALQLGDHEGALKRFAAVAAAVVSAAADRQVRDLGWLAIARVHHDLGHWPDAVSAYSHVGRDSPLFTEALYETAWTLLRDGRHDRAVQALDLLLIHDPRTPIASEIKQLRGKVKIQQRDYRGAEAEFLALRRSFSDLSRKLGGRIELETDARQYFAAVVTEELRYFDLASVLPEEATAIARALPRAVQTEAVARNAGETDAMLADTRDLLLQLSEAVSAREKSRLFTDLAAHRAALAGVREGIREMREDLLEWAMRGRERSRAVERVDAARERERKKLDEPVTGTRQVARLDRVQALDRRAQRLELVLGAMRAQLVATERYYEGTRRDQKIDAQAFLRQAAEQRDAIAALDAEIRELRRRVARLENQFVFHDDSGPRRREALGRYGDALDRQWRLLGVSDAELAGLWDRVATLERRGEQAADALEQAARGRLGYAIRVLEEERVNLERHGVDMARSRDRTKGLAAEVIAAGYRDVLAEVDNMVIRSEVGLLDVAWAIKETETEEVRRLERRRDRDLGELQDLMDRGLEELER